MNALECLLGIWVSIPDVVGACNDERGVSYLELGVLIDQKGDACVFEAAFVEGSRCAPSIMVSQSSKNSMLRFELLKII